MKKYITVIIALAVIQAVLFTSNIFAGEPNETMMKEAKDVNIPDVNAAEKIMKKTNEVLGLETGEANEVSPEEQRWINLETDSEQESSQWLKTDAENISILAKDVNDQGYRELLVLRRIAREEKAENTIKAINRMILLRSQRYQQVIEKAKDEKRQRILQQREERRSRAERRGSEDRSSRTAEPRQGRSRRAPSEDTEMQ